MSTVPKIRPFNVKTALGEAIGDIVNVDQYRQVNIYRAPNGGAGMFAMFPNYMDDDAIRASLIPVLEGPGLLPRQVITDQVSDALVAGTADVPCHELSVELRLPSGAALNLKQ